MGRKNKFKSLFGGKEGETENEHILDDGFTQKKPGGKNDIASALSGSVKLNELSDYQIAQYMKRRQVNSDVQEFADNKIQQLLVGAIDSYFPIEISVFLYQGSNIDKKHIIEAEKYGCPKTIEGFRMFCRAKERYRSKQTISITTYQDFVW